MSLRRVVVTGIGAVTPLGVGAQRSWQRLIAGASGITSVTHLEPLDRWQELPSTVAGLVPTSAAADANANAAKSHGGAGDVDGGKASGLWRPSDWLDATDQRRMSRFAQYALASAAMALEDARWMPETPHDLEATGVCLGSGIGNLEEIYNTALAHHKHVRLEQPIDDARRHASRNPCRRREEHKLRTRFATDCRVTKKYHHCSPPRFSSTWLPVILRCTMASVAQTMPRPLHARRVPTPLVMQRALSRSGTQTLWLREAPSRASTR